MKKNLFLLFLHRPQKCFLRRMGSAGSGSASTERTSEEHSSIEGQAGINMCQIDPFCGSAPTNLSHNMNTKIIKESCNPDATNQPHDATHENVDAGNHSHHIHQIVSALPSIFACIQFCCEVVAGISRQ